MNGIDTDMEIEKAIGKYAALIILPYEGDYLGSAFETPEEALEDAKKNLYNGQEIRAIVRIEKVPPF